MQGLVTGTSVLIWRVWIRRLLQEQHHHAADVRGGYRQPPEIRGADGCGEWGDRTSIPGAAATKLGPAGGNLDATVRVAKPSWNHRFERGGKTGFVTAQGRGYHNSCRVARRRPANVCQQFIRTRPPRLRLSTFAP